MFDDDDIDVLTKPAAKQAAKYTISPDAPVLQTLASQCECELVLNEDGMAMVIYTMPLPEGIHWAEYDVDLSMLTLVTWSGKVMGLGMKIHKPFRKYLKMANQIMLAEMTQDKTDIASLYPAKLVVRHIGI
jgi:hypothetical protein